MSQELKRKSQEHPADVSCPQKTTKDEVHESEDEFFSCKDTENSPEGSPKQEEEVPVVDTAAPTETPAVTAVLAVITETPAIIEVQTSTDAPVTTEPSASVAQAEEKQAMSAPNEEVSSATGEEPIHHSQPTPGVAKTVSELDTTASEGKTPASAEREVSH